MTADGHLSDDARARRGIGPNAVLGDGSLLATLSARGEVEQLFWPHLDRDPNLVELRLGVHTGEDLVWLDDPSLEHAQAHLGDSDVLRTTVRGAAIETIEVTDVVTVAGPVLVRRVAGATGRLAVHLRPALAGTVRAGGAYVDPRTGVLVFHRADRVMAVAVDAPAAGHVAERHRSPGSEVAVVSGDLQGGGIVHGEVDGALLVDAPAAIVTVAIGFATTHAAAIASVTGALADGAAAHIEDRRSAAAQVLAATARPLTDGHAAELYRRSLLTFGALSDRLTGGVIAAPEADPDFRHSGGYGFVWSRDLAFILLAHLAAGRHDLAVPALDWLVRAQGDDGLWLQRNWTDGTLAPSWGTQLDETGAVLVAYGMAVSALASQDPDLYLRLWSSTRRAAEALVATLDPVTGLPAPSMDLWEERVGLHAYTAAATCAGLRVAADLADRMGEGHLAAGWRTAAERVRTGIDAHLWSDEHGRFLRSIQVARSDTDGAPTPAVYGLVDHPATPVGSVDLVDPVVDASLLGLTYPFAVVPADDPRMVATLDAIERRLTAADGGLLRYEGDTYGGGNPWVLTTLWLGLVRRVPGAAVPAAGIDYATYAATSAGLLPEQVDAATGEPAWIVPLTWSHAMLVLASRPDPEGLPIVSAATASEA